MGYRNFAIGDAPSLSRAPWHPTRRQFLLTVGTGLATSRIARSADNPYSLVVFPDEQFLAAGGPLYSELTQWVVDNRHTTAIDGTDLNIAGVIAVGDCANTPSATEASGECAVVKAAYQILDNAGIPHISPPGNHDYKPSLLITSRVLGPNFAAGGFFSPSVRASHAGYGGSYDEDSGMPRSAATGSNWWITLQSGTRQILVIALEFFPRGPLLTWARRIQDAHPNHECIVTTHGYLTDIGVQGDRLLKWGPQDYGLPDDPKYGLSPQEMWGSAGSVTAADPFRLWPNLTAIISGHYIYSAGTPQSRHYHRVPIVSASPHAQMVHQFFCNAQELDFNGDANGADLCILRFLPAAGTLTTYWMSRKSSKWSGDSVAFSSTLQALENGVSYTGLGPAFFSNQGPVIAGVGNGASFTSAIAQGSWITITGSNLSGPTSRTWRPNEIVNGLLPTQLDGVSVKVNGRPAPVYYISPTQINALAPNDDSVRMVPVEVTVDGVPSAPFSVMLQQFAPGLFLWQARDVVATHTDFTLAMAAGTAPGAKPAVPGEVIILWGTGFGKSDPPQPVDVVPTVTAMIDTPVIVHFGGQKVNAISTAMTPQSAGLYQVAVRVPDTISAGDVTVWVEIGGVVSASGLLAVGTGG